MKLSFYRNLIPFTEIRSTALFSYAHPISFSHSIYGCDTFTNMWLIPLYTRAMVGGRGVIRRCDWTMINHRQTDIFTAFCTPPPPPCIFLGGVGWCSILFVCVCVCKINKIKTSKKSKHLIPFNGYIVDENIGQFRH